MKLAEKNIIAIKIAISIILILISFQVFSSAPNRQFDSNDDHGRLQKQLSERIRESLGIWAIIKGVSVVISTVETYQTEVGLSFGAQATMSINPMGGLSVVDNILDQVSNILLWAIGALSVLKILLSVSTWISLKMIIPICIILIIPAIWIKSYTNRMKSIIAGMIIICLGICLAVPLSLEMSNIVRNNILSGQIQKTTNEISSLGAHIENESSEMNDPSFLDMIRRGAKNILNLVQGIKQYVDSLIENVIDYIMIFFVINIIIPILTIFGLKVLIVTVLRYTGFSFNNK